MESDFDSTSEKECAVCLFDLHLFAVGCHCSLDRFTCLYHTKQLCSCSWGVKSCLYRYSVDELNILAEALEGKLSAIHKWAKEDLGFSLSSYISKDRGLICDSSNSLEKTAIGETSQQHSVSTLKDMAGKEYLEESLSSANITGGMCLPQKEMPRQHVTVIENPKVSFQSSKFLHEDKLNHIGSRMTKEEYESEVKKPLFPSKDNVILLSDDEGEKVSGPPSKGVKEKISGSGSVSVSGSNKDSIVLNTMNNATVKCEKDSDLLPDEGKNNYSSMVSSNLNICRNDQGSSNTDGNGITNTENNNNSGLLPNNIDRCIRQKGPRIAKVVRRINSNVELLEYGVVYSGKLWCNSRAIFPKGFKSRVRYISVLDPTNMCYYISQILDAGRDGPLFMVSLEQCSSEVFIHISALKCWDMVRERVNQEIAKQLKLGTKKLPPLQPPGSLDGIDMYGFSTPAIVQVIQKMDNDRLCKEYWEQHPISKSPPHHEGNAGDMIPKKNNKNNGDGDGVETTLGGLFKKTNLKELQAFRTILNDSTSPYRAVVTKLLHQEINKRQR